MAAGDGSAPGRAEQLMDLQRKFSQDLAAEFILTYGKSWTVVKGDFAGKGYEDRSHGLADLGASMQLLCGGNVYCQVSSLVLKTVDEIFGNSSGSTSHKEDFHGTITRDFSMSTAITLGGQAAIDLEVKAPL
jgi:hypothetical protein